MNKQFFYILTFFLILSIIGCSNNGSKTLTATLLNNKPYHFEEAIQNGDVVYLNKVYNFERFQQFLNNVNNKKSDKIRITGYTDEGDPIFKDLYFDGKQLHYSYDNSNDKFGGKNKGVKTDVCSTVIQKERIKGAIDYVVSGCSKNDNEISYFLIRTETEQGK
jgi:hypothetical protein